MRKDPNISRYWKCQLAGWTIASLYWTFTGALYGGFQLGLGLAQLISDVLLYVLITHLYRNFALSNKWQDLALDRLVPRLVIAIPVMAVIYTLVTVLKLYGIKALFPHPGHQSLELFFRLNGLNIFMAGIRLMAIWLLAYHLYHYARREIRIAGEKSKLELSFKEAQLNNLSAQLNPHFLFNALNTIKSLIYTQPDAAGRGVDLLSELLRSGLYKGNTMLVPLEEEIAIAKDYLELESLRLEERLSYEFDIEENIPQVSVPRLSVQTLVENAVKHGIVHEKSGGKVSVSVSFRDDLLVIRVLNPGTLTLTEEGSGIGLQNLKERLLIRYKGKATFNLCQNDKQVCAEIKIPVI